MVLHFFVFRLLYKGNIAILLLTCVHFLSAVIQFVVAVLGNCLLIESMLFLVDSFFCNQGEFLLFKNFTKI